MKKKNVVTSSIIGLISSALAFLGMISVCGFPLIAAFLAWFGIGASHLDFLSQYKSLFTATAIIALLYGFYTIYFKNKTDTSASGCCKPSNNNKLNCGNSSPKSNNLAKTMLWIAAFVVVGTFFMNNDKKDSTAINQNCNNESSTEGSTNLNRVNFNCSTDTTADTYDKKKVGAEETMPCRF